ncbi:uncharacterized protein BCR38DRAFT_508552 [Pseudomassariella vexata]|uniref:Uncharacterized protein n=1 Tax=Pseudomassariella vexata TaxID=1141098 RepID=A0A1Y2ECQ1_9PEZI|nr:uncharacterized protein BCR38DRAFT_508552 [Pseudomassariella vexata]ORY69074.1 hypothetical protein BCR38DRAFT_508552 [Pseudomassariella vexata]
METNELMSSADELRKGQGASRIHSAEMGHPLSWGIVPDLTLGHSSGETAAAYACGALTAEAAMFTATRCGISNVSSNRKGSMAAVGLGRDEIRPYLLPGVDISCENSQCSVTLSGDTEGVEKVMEKLKTDQPGAFARMLRVEKAFHSHHMCEYGPSYEEQLKPVIRSVEPEIAFYSSVTGDLLTGHGKLEASYWRANMESPVLFNSALRSALRNEDGKVVLIEIGPHPALAGPIGQILRDIGRSDVHVGTLFRGKSSKESLLHVAGKLYQHSVRLDLSVVCPPGKFLRDLPRYSWKQDLSHWGEPRVSRGWRFREHPPHELLGNRVVETGSEPCWRKVLALEDALWLTGHEVNGQVVFPAAGSPWYEFTITSFDGTGWVSNCHGEAMASTDTSFYVDTGVPGAAPYPRKVDEKDWYSILRRVGFNYTGLFEGMKYVSAATTSSQAKATVANQIQGAASDGARCSTYSLHPAVIDQCFQLFTVAACRRLRRNTSQLAVPTFIEEMVISPSALGLEVTAKINSLDELGSWTGDVVAHGAERPVLSLKGMKTSVLTRSSTEDDQVPLITQLDWKPHSDFVGAETGLHPRVPRRKEWPLLEELIILCSFDRLERIKTNDETPEHLFKSLNWMRRHTEKYQSGANVLISKDRDLHHLNHEQRLARINAIVAELSDSPDAVFSTAVHRLFVEAPAIFAGETHALHVLLPDNVLSNFYYSMSFDSADAIRLMANTNPHLRVLEVGAGTGGTTARVLQALTSPYGERLYSCYSYTDISAGFMAAAKERFAGAEGMEISVLDISKDPAEQGFQLGSYDLIIGANVGSLFLCNLLSPGGRLFLEELCPDSMFMNYVMAFLSGWWLGADDNRVEQPWISPERWTKELVAAGFQEPEAIVLDSAAPYHLSAGIMVSRESRRTTPSRVTLLCVASDGPYVSEMRRCLEELDVVVDICLFGQPLPACDTISLVDLQEPVLHNMSEETFKTMIGYLQSHKEKMVWVTQASQVNCEDPRGAMMLGLARTARNEYSREFLTIEIDGTTTPPTATKAITDILRRAHTPHVNPKSTDPDYEYAIVEGKILVPRLHWQTMTHAFAGINGKETRNGTLKHLTMTTPGLLHTMKWSDQKIKSPAEGEILVETKAVGLNFRDVVLALGIVQGNPSEMGFEASGIVRAVGPGVQRFSVGDRIMCLGDGCFATHITLQESMCVKIDSSMSFIQGATVPCVYATALMALVGMSNLQMGQSILIHAACGGVGLAAIQIAQIIGAEIYCTVGSETKRKYLMDNYGIDPSHIFTSRDPSFLPEVMRATKNAGVDVVLNSLSGDLLHASWKCVAEFGIMVEIGKRDFQRRAKLAMEMFEANRTFIGLDLRGLSQSRPARAAELLDRCVELIRSGAIRGPTISGTFPAAEIQDAYRTMQAAKHIGKIVVEMPDGPRDLDSEQGGKSVMESVGFKPTPLFRSDRSYLLVGGLGGLGRAVATWMVEHGARNLVFLSRSAQEGPEIQGFLADLRSQGCQVLLVVGSVSSMADVQTAVDTATAAQPIAGVINLSMVLKDVGLSEMTFSDWTAAVEPKVKGTWNLHYATVSSPLDFFLLFSSQSGLIGLWGQANYAAANTFLDAFVQYRHRNGLAASVIDVGLMGDVGYVSGNNTILKSLEITGMYILREQHLLDAIILALKRSRPSHASSDTNMSYQCLGQVVLGLNITTPISSPSTRVTWKRDVRMSIYHNLEKSTETSNSGSSSGGNTLKSLLVAEQSEEEKSGVIAKALAVALANFLIKDEDSFPLDRPLESLGMGSLVAMEVRNWIRQQVGVEISTFTIIQSPSFTHLGDNIRQAMAGEGKT